MADLTFAPQQCVATLLAVLQAISDQAQLFNPTVWAALSERHAVLTQRLPGLREHQRAMPIIEFLGWLEQEPAVVAVAGSQLAAGKSPPRRSGFVTISDEELTQLTGALKAVKRQTATASSIEIPFYVAVEFPATVVSGAEQPLIVQLSRTPPPVAQGAGMVVLTFQTLDAPLAVEVTLRAPGFSEQTGSWSRAVEVSATRAALPAVFLLQANADLGAYELTFHFQQALGLVTQAVKIVAPVVDKGPIHRSVESLNLPAYGEATVDYTPHVAFPAQVRPRSVHGLVVHFALAEAGEEVAPRFGITFADNRRPEVIEAVLTAPDFTEVTGVWQRIFLLYAGRPSQPAVFLVKANAGLGERALTVDFYHKGRLLGSQTTTVEVTDSPAERLAPVLGKRQPTDSEGGLGSILVNPPPPADVTLRIVLDGPTNTLHFSLDARDPALGFQRSPMGTTPLHQSPRQFLTKTFAQLSELAGAGTAQGAEQAQRVEAIAHMGQTLFESLLPKPLQSAYWQLKAAREAGTARSLLIISDEPWIPWELVKPFAYDRASDQPLEDGFWAESFQLCRWLAGPGAQAALTIDSARLVVPETDLPYVEREQRFFRELATRGLEVGNPLRTKAELLQATQSGTMRMLHLATHGTFTAENADESAILLHQDEQLHPTDLAGARSLALRRYHPLVFFNTCHSSQLDFVLTGLGGWAQKLVREIGVSAFVGTLWEVNDALAAEFAIRFYQALIDGATFGVAFQQARLAVRDQDPANPTWLAYTLYADPNGRATWVW